MSDQKKNIQEQIKDLISKNVIVNDIKYAEEYLKTHVNYYRLSSYLRLCTYPNSSGALIKDTSFDHLVELSRIDYQLRKILLEMAINIEFYQKLELNNDCSENTSDDGIQIVNEFLYNNGVIDESPTKRKTECSYSKRIIQKHYPELRVWHLVEILSFGQFIYFFKAYYDKFPSQNFHINLRASELFTTSKIRNACAHNNFILPTLCNKPDNPDRRLILELRSIMKTNPLSKTEENFISKSVLLGDLIYVCMAYRDIVKPDCSDDSIQRLCLLLDSTIVQKSSLFTKNDFLTKAYRIFKKTVDAMFPSA